MRQIKESKRNRGRAAGLVAAILVTLAGAAVAPAQSFRVLVNFDGSDGFGPVAGVVQGLDGSLFGATSVGGSNGSECLGLGCGIIFKVTLGGTLTTVYNFCSQTHCTDGNAPVAGVTLGTDGNFYGITESGGTNNNAELCPYTYLDGCGTVFKVTPTGALTTLYNFCSQTGCADGAAPYASLVQATDGNFYGTTNIGGSGFDYVSCGAIGCGTAFKITPSGTLTTLHSFCSEGGSLCTDGADPQSGLVEGRDGNLYGTMAHGGANDGGTVFKITPTGTLTTLYSFCAEEKCTDGEIPAASLIQAPDGNFYGTTFFGGDGDWGTIFKITPTGTLTTVYRFHCVNYSTCPEGANPGAGLIRATDGNFYGTTEIGGADRSGTVFEVTPTGTLTTLHSFDLVDGYRPTAALVQATSGVLYGTTNQGGANQCSSDYPGCGTIFVQKVGLGPFVETLPASGEAGREVNILGTNLTGATSVTFNGTPAVFKAGSSSFITTTVPAGAATGKVQVVTPGGTLTSNVPFRVLP
jgi:uncharacterized repeat protein (TIGR03803 family)